MNAQITLNSNDNVDLFVTAVDHDLPCDPVCFPNQRTNVGAASPATVEIDGNNQFPITWTAASTADPIRVKSFLATGGIGDPVFVVSSWVLAERPHSSPSRCFMRLDRRPRLPLQGSVAEKIEALKRWGTRRALPIRG